MSGKNTKTRNTIQTQLRPGLQAATAASGEPPAPADTTANFDTTALKLELLAEMRKDIADIFKKELQETLGDALSTIKLDLQAVKTQLASDKAATEATMSKLKGTVGEMEHALTVCSDDIAEMKTTIKSLTADMAKLENKCEDLESRARRNNIRIVGVPEGPDTCTTTALAYSLKYHLTTAYKTGGNTEKGPGVSSNMGTANEVGHGQCERREKKGHGHERCRDPAGYVGARGRACLHEPASRACSTTVNLAQLA
ncbi:unnamed protein product [Menidia menidia]|uniref:(Atlantic silverside) hypothetical protein n=1 Tax=Menidia menidia TaxID=238744 RepID=A0A8S4BVM3_9TELE|nr:unnamed protein product [Menidia menidia]